MSNERQPERTLAEVERENRRLHRAVEELSVLKEIALEIGASLDTERVMSAIVRRSLKAVECEEGAITLIDSDAKPEPHGHTLVRASAGTSDHTAFHVKEALLGWMLLGSTPSSSTDPGRTSASPASCGILGFAPFCAPRFSSEVS